MSMKNYSSILSLLVLMLGGPFIIFAQSGSWATKTPMPTARFWFSCEVVYNKIYAIGGVATTGPSLSIVEVYDPATDTWDTTKTDMPTGRRSMASAVIDEKIYTIGGDPNFIGGVTTGVRTVEIYDPATDTWDTTKTDMLTAREAASASAVNGIIYVIGGVKPGGVASNEVEAYNPVTDEWETKTPMPTARWALSTAVVDGKIFAIGGSRPGGQILKTVELYDTGKDVWTVWTTEASMPVGNGYFGTGLVDGIIYTVGGASNPASPYSQVFACDPSTGEWLEKTAMSMARFALGVGVVNGKIYAIGGGIGWLPLPLSIVEEYDPTLTSVEDFSLDNISTRFVLQQNYPNPFNPFTNIEFSIPKSEYVILKIYNILGEEVATLVSKDHTAGKYKYNWDASSMASGVYLYRIQAGDYVEVKKMVLLR
jgi:N-acetylneuraminic acid mutarotase